MIYLQLFWSFFQIGLFSIGGGYAAMPFIQAQVVELHHWLEMTEFTDLVTIAEMTPGPISINSATFVGTRIAGFWGALTATLGCIAPSILIVSILAFVYFHFKDMVVVKEVLKSLHPAVIALIASAGFTIFVYALFGENGFSANEINWVAAGVFGFALILLEKFKIDPIKVMILCGIVNTAVSFI